MQPLASSLALSCIRQSQYPHTPESRLVPCLKSRSLPRPASRPASSHSVWWLQQWRPRHKTRKQAPSASEHPAPQAATKPNPDHELLAKASSLYYSTARAGLNSFSCEVHPDWRGIILSTQAGSAVAADDPRVV